MKQVVRFIAAAGALVCVSCNVFNPSGAGPEGSLDAEGHVAEGERLLREGNPYAAHAEFAQAIRLDPMSGYARLGSAKASFDKYDLSYYRVMNWFVGDSTSEDSLFDRLLDTLYTWTYATVDSVYAPVHEAVGVLEPMYPEKPDTFVATDQFSPSWVAADFSIILTTHAFLGLLDFDSDGRITTADNPFMGISVRREGDSLVIEGLDAILADEQLQARWKAKAAESVDDAATAARVFTETFADTSTVGRVDSLLTLYEDVLNEQLTQ